LWRIALLLFLKPPLQQVRANHGCPSAAIPETENITVVHVLPRD